MTSLQVYNRARVEALEKKIDELNKKIEFLEARLQIQQFNADEQYLYI